MTQYPEHLEEPVIEALKNGARSRHDIAMATGSSLEEIDPVLTKLYLHERVKMSPDNGWGAK